MIRIKTIKIEEFRGIRELTLDLEGDNFGLCGPNGTGKSGVVDAIEFCLTGNITRLSAHHIHEGVVRRHDRCILCGFGGTVGRLADCLGRFHAAFRVQV